LDWGKVARDLKKDGNLVIEKSGLFNIQEGGVSTLGNSYSRIESVVWFAGGPLLFCGFK